MLELDIIEITDEVRPIRLVGHPFIFPVLYGSRAPITMPATHMMACSVKSPEDYNFRATSDDCVPNYAHPETGLKIEMAFIIHAFDREDFEPKLRLLIAPREMVKQIADFDKTGTAPGGRDAPDFEIGYVSSNSTKYACSATPMPQPSPFTEEEKAEIRARYIDFKSLKYSTPEQIVDILSTCSPVTPIWQPGKETALSYICDLLNDGLTGDELE
jgi:hypothetical protein